VRNCKYIYIYILYVYINRTRFKKFTILLRYSICKGAYVHIFSNFNKILCFSPNDLWTTHQCRYKCIHKTPSNNIMSRIVTIFIFFSSFPYDACIYTSELQSGSDIILYSIKYLVNLTRNI